MSWTKPTEFQRLELAQDCESCGQPAGYWCVTKRGRKTEYLHACRHYLARVREADQRSREAGYVPFAPHPDTFK